MKDHFGEFNDGDAVLTRQNSEQEINSFGGWQL
jgi:hypothetical protein